MKKIFLLLFMFFVLISVFAKEAPITEFHYDQFYQKYTYSDWNEIKKQLTTNILRGNSIPEIQDKASVALNLSARIAKMDLNDSEKNDVRSYLLAFLNSYLNDNRFMELLKVKIEKVNAHP